MCSYKTLTRLLAVVLTACFGLGVQATWAEPPVGTVTTVYAFDANKFEYTEGLGTSFGQSRGQRSVLYFTNAGDLRHAEPATDRHRHCGRAFAVNRSESGTCIQKKAGHLPRWRPRRPSIDDQ